jgi:hypothetical protein
MKEKLNNIDTHFADTNFTVEKAVNSRDFTVK